MQIDLSPAEEAEIRRQAAAVGYESPERYLVDLAINPETTFRPLSDEELRQSAAMCDRGMEEVRAGKVVSVDEARRLSKESLGRRRA